MIPVSTYDGSNALISFDMKYLVVNSLPHHPRLLTTLNHRAFENIAEKGKMLVSSIFSFSHNVFYPSQTKFELFIHIFFVVCECFQFGPVKDFVVW